MENIPSTDIKKVRKLPKRWRKANEILSININSTTSGDNTIISKIISKSKIVNKGHISLMLSHYANNEIVKALL